MQYVYLGNTGLKVSNMCLGTMNFGGEATKVTQCSEEESHKILDAFVAAGGNFIDTADIYSGGESEAIVGRWLAKRADRHRLVIATKARFPVEAKPTCNDVGLSRGHLLYAVEQSLKRLQTDYIDLYQCHAWDAGTPLEETLRTLDDLVKAGKVRYVGWSNVTGWQLQKIVDEAKRLGVAVCVSLQAQYSLLVGCICRHTCARMSVSAHAHAARLVVRPRSQSPSRRSLARA